MKDNERFWPFPPMPQMPKNLEPQLALHNLLLNRLEKGVLSSIPNHWPKEPYKSRFSVGFVPQARASATVAKGVIPTSYALGLDALIVTQLVDVLGKMALVKGALDESARPSYRSEKQLGVNVLVDGAWRSFFSDVQEFQVGGWLNHHSDLEQIITYTISFIVNHELAHIIAGHFDDDEYRRSPHSFEFAADLWAILELIDLICRVTTDETRLRQLFLAGFGIGTQYLLSNLAFSEDPSRDSHPCSVFRMLLTTALTSSFSENLKFASRSPIGSFDAVKRGIAHSQDCWRCLGWNFEVSEPSGTDWENMKQGFLQLSEIALVETPSVFKRL
ncbi:hypothetical protein [Tateyamaria sp. syn59]|uniref:hypothetical protein n=1 Tax=Tateyamaria sp. syn59 TaxID=2576942 RepID=UPI0011BD83CE|nr:hypothetical protein [Tateyamaria sp. syn59]